MSTHLDQRYAHLCTDFYKGIDEQGPYYECVYKFDHWHEADAVCNQMLGKVSGTGASGAVTRVTPHQHPLSPNLWCRSARVEGVGTPVVTPAGQPVLDWLGRPTYTPDGTPITGDLGYPDYSQGFIVRALYRPPQVLYQASDDPYGQQAIDPATPLLWCTQEVDWETETVTTPNNTSKWLTDGTPTGLPTRIEVGITVMRLTFHQVPYVPTSKFRSLRGTVNFGTFLGAPQGTVLFMGGSVSREYSSDGSVNQKVTLTFKERTYAWSKTLRPSTMAWEIVTTDGTTPIYTVADFTPLVSF